MTNFNEYKEILEAKEVTIHHLLKYFKKNEIDYDEYGNIFINFKKENKKLPILVAHTDNVLGEKDRKPVFTLDGKKIFCANDVGIGFDDKAGIIAIIELWKSIPEKLFRIIFTANEEVGGVGARNINENRYNQAKYILELDRRGGKDIIQESGCTRLCSNKFAEKWENIGFKKEIGTFTDLNEFKPKAPKVEMCNLSIGYYNPHQSTEYLNIKEFENIIIKVKNFIIQNQTEEFEDEEEFIKETEYRQYPAYYNRNTTMTQCDCCGSYGPTKYNHEIGMYLCKDCWDWYEEQLKGKEGEDDNRDI